jgi:hexosaminidase
VAWTGAPATRLVERLDAHLPRLDAAGVEYRPLAGPRPWQAGGDGPRRRVPGAEMAKVREHLEQVSTTGDAEESA